MDISKLGTNIRLLREEKGLTREQFCEEEKELSSRQLMRIEKGQSTPTLEKLVYIADKLDVNVIKFFNLSATSDVIPRKYWDLKQEVEKYASYDEEEKELRIEALMKIYDNYYDMLPQDEQLFVDCMMTLNDISETLNTSIVLTTINRYKYVLKREEFGENELIYISLYLIFKSETRAWDHDTDILVEKVIKNTMSKNKFTQGILVRIYLNVSTYYIVNKKYASAIEKLNISIKLVSETQMYKRLPIIYMLLGKSYIGLGKKQKGKQYYQKAIKLSELLCFESLKLKIQTEKDKDVL